VLQRSRKEGGGQDFLRVAIVDACSEEEFVAVAVDLPRTSEQAAVSSANVRLKCATAVRQKSIRVEFESRLIFLRWFDRDRHRNLQEKRGPAEEAAGPAGLGGGRLLPWCVRDAVPRAHEQPVVEPQVSHFRQVPLRTRVKLAQLGQGSPSYPLSRASLA
jgi:hypothetical protein